MQMLQKLVWFLTGMAIGLSLLSISRASVPVKGLITDDTALYQNLSEIRVPKQGKPDFDREIERLARLEGRYGNENLPRVSPLAGAIKRVEAKKYPVTKKR